jgi:hypothetical protein
MSVQSSAFMVHILELKLPAATIEAGSDATGVLIQHVADAVDGAAVHFERILFEVPMSSTWRRDLREVAQASGGRAFAAEDAGALDEVYERLGSQIGTREEKREISAGFAAAGLLALIGAFVTSLRWRGRLP